MVGVGRPFSSRSRRRGAAAPARSRRPKRGSASDVRPGRGRVEAGRDHRHAQHVAGVLVDDRPEDHVAVVVGGLADDPGGLVDLEQAQVGSARDVEQHAGGAGHGRLEQRRRDRGLRRLGGPVLARRRADAHQRRAGVLHDRADVGEVEVDQPGHRDQVGDALHALAQDVVGHPERVDDGGPPLDDLDQPLVRDHDHRVDLLLEGLDALRGAADALRALEIERPRHDPDRQGALLAGRLGDDRRGAGAGAAALARRDEHHVGAAHGLLQLLAALVGRGRAHARVGARPQALGQAAADVDLHVGVAHRERLGVGVHGDELHAADARVDHPVDGVRASAADAHHLDDRQVVARLHVCSPPGRSRRGPALAVVSRLLLRGFAEPSSIT